jgi:hypothetical protein
VLAAVAVFPFLLLTLSQPAPCADATACRQAALDAVARGDFETFHDLAWRAAQRGRPNDPELMYLLARAQSLSGRPGDALVMLRRLAQMGVKTDAAENADFERVRRLAGWPELEAVLASSAVQGTTVATTKTGTASSTPSPAALDNPGKTPPATYVDAPAGRRGTEAALRLSATINPIGLAYDAASRRFVVGDADDNKLVVADEVFDHVNDLIGAASAGFGRLNAVEIDTRRGDLWVTSSDDTGSAAVHKLQLVSGRVLTQLAVPADLQPVVLSDFSIAEDGTLVLVDSRGGRLLRVLPSGGRFERPIDLKLNAPSSIASANGVTYVAHADGLCVVDTASGRVSSVQTAKGVTLSGLRRIRWSRSGLFGLQGDAAATRLVRIRLSANGHRATAVEPADGDRQSVGTALTISRDAAYYVARTSEGAAIRKVAIH